MSKLEDQPLFHWQRRDYEPVRFCLAAIGSLVVLWGLYRLALPSVVAVNASFEEVREVSKLRYDKQANLLFINLEQASSLIPDADFALRDPFNIEWSLFTLSDVVALKSLEKVSAERDSKLSRRSLKYLEVPYQLPPKQQKVRVLPLLPEVQ